MRIKIKSIIVRRRVRRDLAEIDSLVESMRNFGQLSPIVINRDNELIAGERRLTAARRLGWSMIEAVVMDREEDADMLELELEENMQRANLTSDEIYDGYRRLDKLKHPNLFRRIINFFKRKIRISW